MKVGIVLLCLLFGVATASVRAQVTPQTIQPFKSLCIAEQASGFDWNNGKWVHQKFVPKKYILQKIDYEKSMLSGKIVDQPVLCKKPSTTNINKELDIVTACYVVIEFGKVAFNVIDAIECHESFSNGNIKNISCKGVGNFTPNGGFVMLPSSSSLDVSFAKEKDSMAVSVGTCGVL